MACSTLGDLQPAFLQSLQNFLDTGGPRLGPYISNACSIERLFCQLCGQDLVHKQYDFGSWIEANRLAMAHTDLMLVDPNNIPSSQPPSPVAQAPAPPPASPVKMVYDHYRLFPAPGVCFIVPITDPAWLQYKNALFTPRFDKSWGRIG